MSEIYKICDNGNGYVKIIYANEFKIIKDKSGWYEIQNPENNTIYRGEIHNIAESDFSNAKIYLLNIKLEHSKEITIQNLLQIPKEKVEIENEKIHFDLPLKTHIQIVEIPDDINCEYDTNIIIVDKIVDCIPFSISLKANKNYVLWIDNMCALIRL
jgi:hypothetical protein